jgi:hypothetical protein
MIEATAAQSEEVRHRRKVVRLMFPSVGLLWFLGSIAADSWLESSLHGCVLDWQLGGPAADAFCCSPILAVPGMQKHISSRKQRVMLRGLRHNL